MRVSEVQFAIKDLLAVKTPPYLLGMQLVQSCCCCLRVYVWKHKVKVATWHGCASTGGSRGLATTHSQSVARRKWVVNITLRPLCPPPPPPPPPPRKIQYLFYKMLRGPRGQSGRHGKFHCHLYSIPGPSRPQRVSVATALSWPPFVKRCQNARQDTIAHFTLRHVTSRCWIRSNLLRLTFHMSIFHMYRMSRDKFWVWLYTGYFDAWVLFTSLVFKGHPIYGSKFFCMSWLVCVF
jgi:hypothetical protein